MKSNTRTLLVLLTGVILGVSLAVAKELGLERSDMFTPAPDGQKAVQRRAYSMAGFRS